MDEGGESKKPIDDAIDDAIEGSSWASEQGRERVLAEFSAEHMVACLLEVYGEVA